ncbi:MAG: translocation/assembly module TamB [Gemmatimonadota bacterium]|nr:translocation/assembly module TamB [Gemmatimonadota bacterium]
MSRRRLVALLSAGVLFAIGFGLLAVVLSMTQTSRGREYVRQAIVSRIAARLKGRGTLHLGRMGGGLLNTVTFDSLALRDEEDSLIVSTGPVSISYDPRDLVDRRLLLRQVSVAHPFVNLRRRSDGEWNFRHVFPNGPPDRIKHTELSFGDFVVIDTAVVHGGTLLVTLPWHPDDSLHGARRDSAIAQALASASHEVRRTREGLKLTRRWSGLEAFSPHVRIADPDSAGHVVVLGSLDFDEADPPFIFRRTTGVVRHLGDSVWFNVKHWDLPASTGTALGKVWWGKGPIRYDVHVHADSFALNDVNWVYPTLPRRGGGKGDLVIRNDRRNPEVLDYALSNLDVRSERSHLAGTMTFAVGEPVLAVNDVALTADPVDFDLIRTLNGKPFPVDWQGRISGTIRARGGPLNRWVVDDAKFSFADAHVAGAVTSGSGRGALDILVPANTVFRNFAVNVESLDLRSIEYLFPAFPRVNGTIAGQAILDSLWLDVRFHDADITHRDGEGEPSHFTGSGRVTNAEKLIVFDVDLQAQPISFTMLARSYPLIPMRGSFTGPMRIKGTMDDLDLTTTLAGTSGTLALDGHFDFLPPVYAARATMTVRNLDLRTLFDRPSFPVSRLTATASSDIHGDSLADLVGTVAFGVERSRIDTLRIYPSMGRLTFGNGRMTVDTLRVETTAATLVASGALGLTLGVTDSLRYRIMVDSLGGLRPWLRSAPSADAPSPPPAAVAAAAAGMTSGDSSGVALSDSLSGVLEVDGMLLGSASSLRTSGRLSGHDLFLAGTRAASLRGNYHLAGLPDSARGGVQVVLDSVQASGIRIATANAHLELADRSSGRAGVNVLTANDVRASAALGFSRERSALRLVLDTLLVRFPGRGWSLTSPAHALLDSSGVVVDDVQLRNGAGGLVDFRGAIPTTGPLAATVKLDSLPLADIGMLAQLREPLAGDMHFDLELTGTRARPVMKLSAAAHGSRYGTIGFPDFSAGGSYADQRLKTNFQLYQHERPVLTFAGSLPLDLALGSVSQRLLPDSLSGELRADSLDLALVEAISPALTRVTGRASTIVDIGGSWRRPLLDGRFAIANGDATVPSLGIRLRRIGVDVRLARDTVRFLRASAQSGDLSADTVSLTGFIRVPDYTDPLNSVFNDTLLLNHFVAVRNRRLADLEMSGGLTLIGPYDRPRLAGALTIDRGTVYIPDQAQKQIVSLADPEFANFVDTTLLTNQVLIPKAPPALVRNLTPQVTIGIGDDVWLRSAEANIKLGGGPVSLTRRDSALALSGSLDANRGTYRLNLGPVQRTFTVDEGSVRFFGDPDIPPELHISATYTVRRLSQQDLRLRAILSGTLLQPKLDLQSDERFPISRTEILSYLIVGAPSFALGGQNSGTLRQATSVLLPSLGSVLEQALSEQIRIFDTFQIQAPNSQDVFSAENSAGALGYVSGTTLSVGRQISDKTYLTLSSVVCGQGGNASSQQLALKYGVTVEHRLEHGFWVQGGIDPGSAPCSNRLDLTYQKQKGFDLFREWRF